MGEPADVVVIDLVIHVPTSTASQSGAMGVASATPRTLWWIEWRKMNSSCGSTSNGVHFQLMFLSLNVVVCNVKHRATLLYNSPSPANPAVLELQGCVGMDPGSDFVPLEFEKHS